MIVALGRAGRGGNRGREVIRNQAIANLSATLTPGESDHTLGVSSDKCESPHSISRKSEEEVPT